MTRGLSINLGIFMAISGMILMIPTSHSMAQITDFTPVTDATLQDPDPADWVNWRRTLDAQAHSPLTQITTDNASRLRLIWSWAMTAGSQQTTPLVYDGIMYLANPGEIVQALHASTGELLWE